MRAPLGKAWDWWIENVLEECDSPGEYFYDAEAQLLYYTFNASEVPTGDEKFALTRTKVRTLTFVLLRYQRPLCMSFSMHCCGGDCLTIPRSKLHCNVWPPRYSSFTLPTSFQDCEQLPVHLQQLQPCHFVVMRIVLLLYFCR